MTLRARLMLVLVGVVTVGLAVSGVVTYKSLESFLVSRLDQQLTSSPNLAGQALYCQWLQSQPVISGNIACNSQLERPDVPVGTFVQLRTNEGIVSGWVESSNAKPPDPPGLPASPITSSIQDPSVFDVSGPSVSYHAIAVPFRQRNPLVGAPDQGVEIVAVPLTGVDQTLGRLIWIEVLVGLAVLVVLGVISWLIVRRGLKPLDQMATTAGAIAAGDLTQRVPQGDPSTEVGRLGDALNVMLGEIQESFEVRKASEERLRRFLADASHELRTPLTSIRGYAEMFDRGTKDRPEDLATSMRHIRTDAERMSSLVDDLLLLARLGRERPLAHEVVDMRDVVREAVSGVSVQEPHRSISLSADAPVRIVGDGKRLRQVVDNLLVNAVRHTPSGTPIEVSVSQDPRSALVTVEDHGAGIPESERKRIFEPFNRIDRSRSRETGGEGLGLAIVATIVEAHGGHVGVGDSNSGGARFWVRLPLEAPITSAAESNGSADGVSEGAASPAPRTVPVVAPGESRTSGRV